MKAEALRQSGKLDFRACDLTGSTEEHMKIWIVPVAMTSHIDRDTKGAAAVNEGVEGHVAWRGDGTTRHIL